MVYKSIFLPKSVVLLLFVLYLRVIQPPLLSSVVLRRSFRYVILRLYILLNYSISFLLKSVEPQHFFLFLRFLLTFFIRFVKFNIANDIVMYGFDRY